MTTIRATYLASLLFLGVTLGSCATSPVLDSAAPISLRESTGDKRLMDFDAKDTKSAIAALRISQIVGREAVGIVVVGTPLTPDSIIPDQISDAFGALILKKGNPSNPAACQAFFNQHIIKTPGQVLSNNMSRHRPLSYRPTFWLDERRATELGGSAYFKKNATEICKSLLPHYDYERALFIATNFGVGGRNGPLLIAWRTNLSGAVTFDLSGYKSETDFGKVMQLWQQEISTDTTLWQIGAVRTAPWYISVREAFNQAGQAVETAVRLWKPSAAIASQ